MTEGGRKDAPLALFVAPGEREPARGHPGAGDAHVELPGRDLEQHPGIVAQVTEQVDLVAPGPGIRKCTGGRVVRSSTSTWNSVVQGDRRTELPRARP